MGIITTFNPLGGGSIDWKSISITNSYRIRSLYSANNIIIGIVERSSTDDNGKLIYSYDGIIWNDCVVPNNAFCYGKIVWGGDKFVKIGRPINSLIIVAMYSYDGITWQYSNLPNMDSWTGLAYGAGKFITTVVALGVFTTDNYAYSYDGINWVSTEFPFQHAAGGPISYTNGYFIYGAGNAFHTDETVISSTDGLLWSVIGNPDKEILKSFVTPFQHYIFVKDYGWYKSIGNDFVKVVNDDAVYLNINWIGNKYFNILINKYNTDIHNPVYIEKGTTASASTSFTKIQTRKLPSNIYWCTPIYVAHLKKFLTMAYNEPYIATLDA